MPFSLRHTTLFVAIQYVIAFALRFFERFRYAAVFAAAASFSPFSPLFSRFRYALCA